MSDQTGNQEALHRIREKWRNRELTRSQLLSEVRALEPDQNKAIRFFDEIESSNTQEEHLDQTEPDAEPGGAATQKAHLARWVFGGILVALLVLAGATVAFTDIDQRLIRSWELGLGLGAPMPTEIVAAEPTRLLSPTPQPSPTVRPTVTPSVAAPAATMMVEPTEEPTEESEPGIVTLTTSGGVTPPLESIVVRVYASSEGADSESNSSPLKVHPWSVDSTEDSFEIDPSNDPMYYRIEVELTQNFGYFLSGLTHTNPSSQDAWETISDPYSGFPIALQSRDRIDASAIGATLAFTPLPEFGDSLNGVYRAGSVRSVPEAMGGSTGAALEPGNLVEILGEWTSESNASRLVCCISDTDQSSSWFGSDTGGWRVNVADSSQEELLPNIYFPNEFTSTDEATLPSGWGLAIGNGVNYLTANNAGSTLTWSLGATEAGWFELEGWTGPEAQAQMEYSVYVERDGNRESVRPILPVPALAPSDESKFHSIGIFHIGQAETVTIEAKAPATGASAIYVRLRRGE